MSLWEKTVALYERLKGASWEERKAALAEVPENLQKAYHEYRKDRMYDPENAQGSEEHLSPSGRYKLVVTSFTSGPGTWDVTEGVVFRIDSDEPIASIRRNYRAFPFLFVEGHADGHDYLIGGEDYQGQTIIQLTTGAKRGLLPEEAKQGHGFCWSSYQYNAATKLLFVDGCYWACPYEFRFYDFSDPMNGWPLLEYVPMDEENGDAYVESDHKDPTFEADGTIVTYETRYGTPSDENQYDDEDEDENGNTVKRPQRVVATRTWRREGMQLKEVAYWIDPEEKKRREEAEKRRREWEEWLTNFKANDPLYTRLKELVAQGPFKPSDYTSTGWTHVNWCPDFKESENRICWDIHHAGTFKVTVEIAMKTGPVKLIMYNSKEKGVERFFMEHSVASVEQAIAAAREFLAGDP
jgi:hypothetical protein